MVSVGRFRLGTPLGEGGTAIVYDAEDAAGRRGAVKVLRTELRNDSVLRQRMRREGEILGGVVSPHVVAVLDSGEDPVFGPYVVTERCSGPRLSEVLARAPEGLDPRRATALVAQVLDGLAALHEAGALHRDVKPDNIFVEARGGSEHAVLFDLGAGAVTGGDALTAVGRVIGSLRYASPERARGDEAGPGTDLWAAGVLLFVCLTGTDPFVAGPPGAGGGASGVPLTPLAAVSRGVPRPVAAVVTRALERAPAGRYPDARSMAAALRLAQNA